ncbi:hypothetical protein [Actinophytocola sp.]|uniref:hypothetical protein n=1 Tax=Actinophytocola sp. TaxID=1872138 RepID=UPI00389AB3E8
MSLFVVYVQETNHVVGAVRANGAAAPTVAELVGDELPLRVWLGADRVATLTLKVSGLAVREVDDEPGVFAEPLAFAVDQGSDGQPPKPTLVPLKKSTVPLKFEVPGLTVAVDGKVGDDTPVRVLISYGQSSSLLVDKIDKGGTETTLQTLVDDDPHGVLVLVPGWAGRLEKVEKQ